MSALAVVFGSFLPCKRLQVNGVETLQKEGHVERSRGVLIVDREDHEGLPSNDLCV